MNEIQFSPSQKMIVEKTQGAMSVIASAGSGKTRVLTGRVRYLLENIPGSYKILALTFTNKAAEEMKDRLGSVSNINERVFIGTIHSFCLSIIREKGNLIGFNEMPHIFEKENDRLEVVKEVFLRNELLTHYYEQLNSQEQRTLLYKALDYINNRKRTLQLIEPVSEIELSLLFDDYNRFLVEQNAIDYDDIIILAYRIFTERPKIAELYRKIYQYICVDEAQDLNFAQYQFLKILCGTDHRNILMVGDDKQAIFGFNGSDKKYFSEIFVYDFNAEKIELTENYRNSKAVIRIANTIYPNSINEQNAVYEGIFEKYAAENEKDEVRYIIKKIMYYLNDATTDEKAQIEGDISLDKMCVIARNKYVFKQLENELISQNLPFFYKKGSDTVLFESDEMRIFELGVRIILNPSDKLHLREVHSILNDTKLTSFDFDKTKKYLADYSPVFSLIVESWLSVEKNRKNLREALEIIQNGLNDIKIKNNENSLELIYQETSQAKEFWKKYSTSVPVDSISIQGFFSQVALGMVIIKNKKETGVTLATVHSVKGLEYDIAFVIGLNEGTFPDYRALKANKKQMEEEKNLTNVALTRAKRFLHISYPKLKFMPWDQNNPYPQRPSRFLKHMFNGSTY